MCRTAYALAMRAAGSALFERADPSRWGPLSSSVRTPSCVPLLHEERRRLAPVALADLRQGADPERRRRSRRQARDGRLGLEGGRQVDPRLAAVGAVLPVVRS